MNWWTLGDRRRWNFGWILIGNRSKIDQILTRQRYDPTVLARWFSTDADRNPVGNRSGVWLDTTFDHTSVGYRAKIHSRPPPNLCSLLSSVLSAPTIIRLATDRGLTERCIRPYPGRLPVGLGPTSAVLRTRACGSQVEVAQCTPVTRDKLLRR